MAVEIRLVSEYNEGESKFEAIDLETGKQVETKNSYEKSKSKWHIVLAANSANRKYISHNEFNNNRDEDTGVYTVVDKTTGPRVLGTANPDAKLVPFMTAEDKVTYDEIMQRAEENQRQDNPAELDEEAMLEAELKKLQARLEARRNGEEYVEEKVTRKRKSRVDYIDKDDEDTYLEIIERATEAKKNAPKAERKARGPLTDEQKIKMDENKMAKLAAKLAAMRAAKANPNTTADAAE